MSVKCYGRATSNGGYSVLVNSTHTKTATTCPTARRSITVTTATDTMPDIDGAPPELVTEVWDRDEYRIKAHVGVGTWVIDIGAHVGVFSLFAASLGATVTAVEPHYGNWRTLTRNTADVAVTAIYAAAGATDGNCATTDLGLGVYTRPGDSIAMISLATLLDGREAVVKLDCEGAEYGILPGADLALVPYLTLEFHAWTIEGDPVVEGWGVRPSGRMPVGQPEALIAWIEQTHRVVLNGSLQGGGYLYCTRL